MLAMIVKEFRQVGRDRRTLVMMLALPVLLLVVFGYAASFDVDRISTIVVGSEAETVATRLPDKLDVKSIETGGDRHEAEDALRDGDAVVAVVAEKDAPVVLVDGSELFAARAAVTGLAQLSSPPKVEVLFNSDLSTSAVMVPAIIGLILLFIGTMITSLGIVRERQAGTLEQLAVMPLRARDVILGKVAPYLLVAMFDMAVVTAVGVLLFDVPFRGSVALLVLGSVLFLLVTLGVGVLISTVSENTGQAIQLALMFTLPQILLSGMVFPLDAMAPGVRWISYLLPLRYFIEMSRGIMIRGAPLSALWFQFAALFALGIVVFGFALARFRRELTPSGSHSTAAPATAR